VNEAREALDRLINVHVWNLNNNEATAAHPEEFESTENKMEEEEAQGYKFSTKDVSNALYGSNGSVNVNEQEWWGCDLWSLVTDVNEILTDDDTAMCYSVIDVGSGVFRVVLDVEETSNFRGNVWNCRDGKRFRFHLSWDCVRSAPAVKVEVGNVGWVVSQTDISIQRAAKKHENLDNFGYQFREWNLAPLLHLAEIDLDMLNRSSPDLCTERMADAMQMNMSEALDTAPTGILSLPGCMTNLDTEAQSQVTLGKFYFESGRSP
jgi:hypothetical protein